MSDDLDLDSIAAAEAESAGTGFTATLGGDRFTFPPVLPYEFFFTAPRDIKAAYDLVLGDDAEKFWAHKPGRKVMEALDAGLAKHYGFGKWGNSSASDSSSRNGSGPSKQTSNASTG